MEAVFREPGRWKWQNRKLKEHLPWGRSQKNEVCTRGDSLVSIHQLPVPGGKLWMGTKETLLVYRNIIFELVVPLQP